jgi:hypothetical protein
MKKILLIILLLVVGCSSEKKPPKSSLNQSTDKRTQKQTLIQPSGNDLIGYDWVYHDMTNLMAAWKFISADFICCFFISSPDKPSN